MEEKKLICVGCPKGCAVTVRLRDGAVAAVEGNLCPKGEAYARQEAVNPCRTLTCLMRAGNRAAPFSVKSTAPIPREALLQCVAELYRTRPQAPIRAGEVVARNICGTGADVAATRDLP